MILAEKLSRVPAWVAACGSIAGTVAAVAMFGVLTAPVEAAESTDEDPCGDAWEDAPAQTYCTDTAVTKSGDNCHIDVSTCSITVTIEDMSITFTPTWPSSYSSSGDGLSLASTDDIDICFAMSASVNTGYTATVKAPCDSGETGSASATTDGLAGLQ